MPLYNLILEKSKEVDIFWSDFKSDFVDIEIDFGKYKLQVKEIFSENIFPEKSIFLVDQNLKLNIQNSFHLTASERETKSIDYINNFISENKKQLEGKVLVAVGGGVILDTCLCIAEILHQEIILVPTTILSMSDSSIGGKARANKIEVDNGKEIFLKHFYKKIYNPKEIIICENFLETIPDQAILFSCAEIIKHAFFQSEKLVEYLLSEKFDPFKNKNSLLKAILWTTDLKRICMEVDPEETEEGSKIIIREGHEIADKLEKESGFTMSHGKAVLHGLEFDLKTDPDVTRLERFQKICEKLKIV